MRGDLRAVRSVVLALGMCAGAVRAEEPAWVDARVSLTAQFFRQGLLPGAPGTVARVEPAYPLMLGTSVRFGAIDVAGATDLMSGEVSAWGSVGARDGRSADADVTTAWAQARTKAFRLRLGRQVTLPGSSRYVRFDGLSVGATAGWFDFDAYGGWVALPRWNLPRGATVLGFAGDALSDPLLAEAQNRAGQVVAGARVAVRLPRDSQLALAFHEQHDAVGPAFRVLTADGRTSPLPWLSAGARVGFDLQALAVPEARVWADITALSWVPVSVDYTYQKPSLLLPQTSVLAAFGGASWHEAGVEVAARALPTLEVRARGAATLFEGDRLGGRGQLGVRWKPGLDGRWLVLGEVARVLAPPSGYTQLRAGARWRAAEAFTGTADAAVYFYDTPVRGVTSSLAATAGLEWAPLPWLRALTSVTLMRTPYAELEAQALLRLAVNLEAPAPGGKP